MMLIRRFNGNVGCEELVQSIYRNTHLLMAGRGGCGGTGGGDGIREPDWHWQKIKHFWYRATSEERARQDRARIASAEAQAAR